MIRILLPAKEKLEHLILNCNALGCELGNLLVRTDSENVEIRMRTGIPKAK